MGNSRLSGNCDNARKLRPIDYNLELVRNHGLLNGRDFPNKATSDRSRRIRMFRSGAMADLPKYQRVGATGSPPLVISVSYFELRADILAGWTVVLQMPI